MLTKEQIDMQNQEGIAFLRKGLAEILEKMRSACGDAIPEAEKRIRNLHKNYDKCDPDGMEKRRTVLSNILFFIGSIFAPAVTPSEWFGRQKISEDRRDLANKYRKQTLDFLSDERNMIRYNSDAIALIDGIITDIEKNDAALADLINEIGLRKKDKDRTMWQWISFLEAFVQCKYLTEEEYDHMWRYVLHSYGPMVDFVKLCDDYTIQYGLKTG